MERVRAHSTHWGSWCSTCTALGQALRDKADRGMIPALDSHREPHLVCWVHLRSPMSNIDGHGQTGARTSREAPAQKGKRGEPATSEPAHHDLLNPNAGDQGKPSLQGRNYLLSLETGHLKTFRCRLFLQFQARRALCLCVFHMATGKPQRNVPVPHIKTFKNVLSRTTHVIKYFTVPPDDSCGGDRRTGPPHPLEA